MKNFEMYYLNRLMTKLLSPTKKSGGVSKSMLTLNEAIIDVKEG